MKRKLSTFVVLLLLVFGGVLLLWPTLKSVLEDHVRPSPSEETANKLLVLETRIRLFAAKNRRFPEKLEEVVCPQPYGQDLLTDGWGNPLRFRIDNHAGNGPDAVFLVESVQQTDPPDRLRAEFRIRRNEADSAYATEWIVEPWSRDWRE